MRAPDMIATKHDVDRKMFDGGNAETYDTSVRKVRELSRTGQAVSPPRRSGAID